MLPQPASHHAVQPPGSHRGRQAGLRARWPPIYARSCCSSLPGQGHVWRSHPLGARLRCRAGREVIRAWDLLADRAVTRRWVQGSVEAESWEEGGSAARPEVGPHTQGMMAGSGDARSSMQCWMHVRVGRRLRSRGGPLPPPSGLSMRRPQPRPQSALPCTLGYRAGASACGGPRPSLPPLSVWRHTALVRRRCARPAARCTSDAPGAGNCLLGWPVLAL
jgi:hypothetical protein